MLGILFRLVFAALCATLIVSTWEQTRSTTVVAYLHDTYYQVRPHLREIRLGSTFGVLIFCLLLAKRDPLFTRLGVLSVLVSLTIMLIPPREVHQTVTKIEGIKFDPNR